METTLPTQKPPAQGTYSASFIDKVNSQVSAHPIALTPDVLGEGVVADAKVLLIALVSCGVARRTVDTLLRLEPGNTEAYLIGGITTLTPENAAVLFEALHKIKTFKVDHLRGSDQLAVLNLVLSGIHGWVPPESIN
jgi:hypothetical protein